MSQVTPPLGYVLMADTPDPAEVDGVPVHWEWIQVGDVVFDTAEAAGEWVGKTGVGSHVDRIVLGSDYDTLAAENLRLSDRVTELEALLGGSWGSACR